MENRTRELPLTSLGFPLGVGEDGEVSVAARCLVADFRASCGSGFPFTVGVGQFLFSLTVLAVT